MYIPFSRARMVQKADNREMYMQTKCFLPPTAPSSHGHPLDYPHHKAVSCFVTCIARLRSLPYGVVEPMAICGVVIASELNVFDQTRPDPAAITNGCWTCAQQLPNSTTYDADVELRLREVGMSTLYNSQLVCVLQLTYSLHRAEMDRGIACCDW